MTDEPRGEGAARHPTVGLVDLQSVDLRDVERQLAALWRVSDGSQASATRACMSNLIVFCSSEQELSEADRDLPGVAREHPSRIVLLGAESEGTSRGIEASVSAYCYLGVGRRKICSEHVTLRAAGQASKGLPASVRSLLIGDLPTALWWSPSHRAPPEFGRLFEQLAAASDHVLYDSGGWTSPIASMLAAEAWASGAATTRLVSDLAWQRLEPWRVLLAQGLDPGIAPGALGSLERLEIEHGPHALPKAWLFVGWLAYCLGWKPETGTLDPGVEITWRFRAPHGPVDVALRRRSEGDPELERVSVRWGSGGKGGSETIERVGPGRLAVGAESGAGRRVVSTPPRTRSALVALELANRRGGRLFREAMQVAAAMAGSLER